MARDLLVSRKPHSAATLHMLDEAIENRHARAMAHDVRVHRQDVEPAFGVGDVEL